MNLEQAVRAKDAGEVIGVIYAGIVGRNIRAGQIVDIKTKLRSGVSRSFASVKWNRPGKDGSQQSDVLLTRVKPIRELLCGIA